MKKITTLFLSIFLLIGCKAKSTTTVSETTQDENGVKITETTTTENETTSSKASKKEEEDRFIENADITFINEMDFDIYELYITPTGDSFGQEALQEDAPLEAGYNICFNKLFSYHLSNNLWDIKLVDGDGNVMILEEIDVLTAADENDLQFLFTCDDESIYVTVQ